MSFIKKKESLKDKVIQYLESITEQNDDEDEESDVDEESDEDYDDDDEDSNDEDSDDEDSDDEDSDDEDSDDEDSDDEDSDDEDDDDDDEDSEDDDDSEDDEDGEYDSDDDEYTSEEEEGSVIEYDDSSSDNSEDTQPMKMVQPKKKKLSTDSDSEPIVLKGEPTLFHMFSNEPYFHLPAYSSDIEIVGNESLQVHICAYVLCNNTYNDPYISFLVEFIEKSNLYSLPSFIYEPLNNVNHHDFLKNKCLEILFPILNVTPETMDDNLSDITEKAYKGYIHHSGTNSAIIGINVEDFIPFLGRSELTLSDFFRSADSNVEPVFNWAIVDEILHNKSIDNHPIDPKILSIFETNKSIYQMLKTDDKLTETPRMLYLCASEKSTLDNNSLSPLSKSVNKEFGRVYLFTEKPSKKRFIVFPTFHYKENGADFFGVLSQDKFREF